MDEEAVRKMKARLEFLELENAELRKLQYDSVTRLRVRALLERDAAHAVSGNSGKHLVLVDVDCLSMWNDLFGHYMGDRVLQSLARILEGQDREASWYRSGGDELAGLMDGPSQRVIAELRRASREFSQLQLSHQQPFPPSFAWGMCSVTEANTAVRELAHVCPEVGDLDERDRITLRKQFLLQIADGRAYAAKICQRSQLLLQILRQEQGQRFEELARWLLKGLNLTRFDIEALEVQGEATRIRVLTSLLQRNSHGRLGELSRIADGLEERDVAFRRIVQRASKLRPNQIRDLVA